MIRANRNLECLLPFKASRWSYSTRNLYYPRTRAERYTQNYPHLQRFFWCAVMVHVSISTARLYDRYWPVILSMGRGKSSGAVSVPPSSPRLGMMAAAWQKAGQSSPPPREGQGIFKWFVLLLGFGGCCCFVVVVFVVCFFFILNKTCISLPSFAQRYPHLFQTNLIASGSNYTSWAAFASGLHQ